jgi:hypothetical protein
MNSDSNNKKNQDKEKDKLKISEPYKLVISPMIFEVFESLFDPKIKSAKIKSEVTDTENAIKSRSWRKTPKVKISYYQIAKQFLTNLPNIIFYGFEFNQADLNLMNLQYLE